MSFDVLAVIRAQIRERGARWDAAQTTVSGLSTVAKTRRLGLKFGPTALQKGRSRFKIESSLTRPTFPPVFSWRNYGGLDYVGVVKDQDGCGSCVAFACVAVLESQLLINGRGRHSLSEAFLFSCGGGDCENGWDIEPALQFLRNPGVTDEPCLPYWALGLPSPCEKRCANWKQRLFRISGHQELATPDFAKFWISSHGPLVAGMDVYDDFPYYKGGIYSHVYGANIGQHAIALIGYDDDSSCWICKNSWGIGWGEAGFFALEYGQCNVCVQYPAWGISGPVTPF